MFRLNKDGSGFVVLHVYIDSPNPGSTEGTPRTRLFPAVDGKLYGLTSGGSVAEGTVFRISPRLTLRIQPGSEGMLLSWPACPVGYVLEESEEPGGVGGWTRVETPGEVVGTVRRVVMPRSDDQRFFRLLRL